MKSIFYSFLTLMFLSNCSAQKHDIYSNSYIEKDNYTLTMEKSEREDSHTIKLSRAVDSLYLEVKITPSLDEFFKNITSINKSKLIVMTIKKNAAKYIIEQIDFLHLDKRKTSIHKYSADIFNLDLNDYQIDVIKCTNCTDRISFKLYENPK